MTDRIKLNIWGKDFLLPVQYDCFADEEISAKQLSALSLFIGHPEWINNAKNKTEEYCVRHAQIDSCGAKQNNIFSYLKPEYIYVKRSKEDAVVALLCKYRYDIEHGIAIVFDRSGKVIVDLQDMIL